MQRQKLFTTSALLVIVAVAAFASVATYALTVVMPGFPGPPARYVYTVKFVCNIQSDSFAVKLGLQPGYYGTDINLHNPSFTRSNVTFVENIVLSDPNFHGIAYVSPGPQYFTAQPSPYLLRTVTLGPNAAARIDCYDILKLLDAHYNNSLWTTSYAIGFVEFITIKPIPFPGMLDVWAEYTVRTCAILSNCSTGPTMQVMQVQPSQYVP